ncbi:hypothetical protein Pla110_02650 [Polystyrenella longa]|uniref:Uncharacterized protein n=1 Tax=Polystyrenella longa TaxID=2528007 RepID=A0A518CH60_9PLAN|nr:hypothetical protein [Polystyrenella longa]QDU78561.1 hypothetical protein Pla110_02650 [Polystyrenella longa]
MRTLLKHLPNRKLLRNILLLGLAMTLFFVVAIFCWRSWRLNTIPDVGEPFDVEGYLQQYDGIENNAFDVLREASDLLIEVERDPKFKSVRATGAVYKEKRSPRQQEYISSTDAALDLWLNTSEMPQGYEVHPRELSIDSLLDVSQSSRTFNGLIISRMRAQLREGQTTEALELQRQLLNINLHFRDGVMISQLCAIASYSVYWQNLPHLLLQESWSAEELRSLLKSLKDFNVACPPVSDGLKSEYFLMRNLLEENTSKKPIMNSITREDEISRRVLNRIFNNWFDAVDRPTWERPAVFDHECFSFNLSAWLEPNSSAMQCHLNYFGDSESQDLVSAYHRLSFTQGTFNLVLPAIRQYLIASDRDHTRRELATCMVALHLYHREQGHFPDRLEELVPQYLEEVPRNRDVASGKPEQAGSPIEYRLEEGNALLRPVETWLHITVYPPGEDPTEF